MIKFHSSSLVNVIIALIISIVFFIAYGQDSLYFSSQNTYMAIGLQEAGLGNLSEDLFATGTDPFPAFSMLVNMVYTTTGISLFYGIHFLLLAIFIWSLMSIAEKIFPDNPPALLLLFFTAITFTYSIGFSSITSKLFNYNASVLFQSGVAGQFVLGRFLIPSLFGVLLISSIAAYLNERKTWAIILLGVAATFHPTYLLSAAFITLAYMILEWHEKGSILSSLKIGVLSLLCVLPIVIYSLINFPSVGGEVTEAAQKILVDFRIRHHAHWFHWLDKMTLVQIMLSMGGLWLIRKHKLFYILAIPFVLSLGLSLIQVASGSRFLALLFPWRPSVFIMPLTSAILVLNLHNFVLQRFKHRQYFDHAIYGFSVIVLFPICMYSQSLNSERKEAFENAPEVGVMNFVQENKMQGESYLIPVDLQRFRLYTGAPVFVDHKNHPYEHAAVVSWYNDLTMAQLFYETIGEDACDVAYELHNKRGVTHLVLPMSSDTDCSEMKLLWEDENYRLYQIGERRFPRM